jgi:hypothetical protein
MEAPSSPKLRIKASPSHIRVAQLLEEQVKKEYEEFLMRERAGTLTPRPTELCSNCKNEFVKGEMVLVQHRQLSSGVSVKDHYYCTEECQAKGELNIMRKAEEDDERRRIFKYRSVASKWFNTVLASLALGESKS